MKPQVLSSLTYGMYAIGVKDGNKPNACICNTVMQLTKATPADNPLVAVSMHKANYSCGCIQREGVFTISVLSQETPASVIGALGLVSGEHADKLENVRHKVLIEGVPVIKENTCCWFLCKVKEVVEAGAQRRVCGRAHDLPVLRGAAGRGEPQALSHLPAPRADLRQVQRGELCVLCVRLRVQRSQLRL